MLMSAGMLLLMTYAVAGEKFHEWLGVVMLSLFLIHHIINKTWHKNLFRGSYTPLRTMLLIIDLLVLACMLAQAASGIALSKHVFAPLQIHTGMAQARMLHMLGAYWGFVLMAIHLGMHWKMVSGMLSLCRKDAASRSSGTHFAVKALLLGLSAYGARAFVQHDLASYMFWERQFAFIDYEQPLLPLLADYASIAVLFAAAGHGAASFRQKKIT